MANINGLTSMKGETIWSEFKTILMHPKRYECMEAFLQCGGATHLGKLIFDRWIIPVKTLHQQAVQSEAVLAEVEILTAFYVLTV